MKYDDQDMGMFDKKQDNALIAVLCGICIALATLVSLCVRGCSPEPVAAYSLCEQCGEIIWQENAGRCLGREVAHGK